MKKRPLPHTTLIRFMILLAFPALACQLGSSVEVTPTPAVVVETAATTASPATAPPTAEADPPSDAPLTRTIEDLQNVTVQIFAKTGGFIQWTGSGTIISPDGLILTNAHVASPTTPGLAAFYQDPEFLFTEEPDELVVALVDTADSPPIETYQAEVAAADGTLDLAVIRVVATVEGTAVDPATLDLPYLPLGDSDLVRLGDEVRVLGFPGAGGDTITFTRGDVSGFESQDLVGTRAWIKTDTAVSPGNSGGLGANLAGELIGVPSFVIEATGGAINRLRSINLARPLIEMAQENGAYESPYMVEGSGEETFTLVTWAEDFDQTTACAIDPVTAYPSGAIAAVAIFDYAGMTDGEQLLITWFWQDDPLFTTVINWTDGPSGDCFAIYIHNYGEPIEDGAYLVELYAGANLDFVTSAEVTVGGTGAAATSSASSDGVQVQGRITDADTGRPVAGATIFMLYPDVDLDAWLAAPTEDDVLTFAESNARGEYRLPYLLERGFSYPGVIEAAGYRAADGFLTIEADDPNPLTLDIELSP